jgi:hypothetical protein
MEAYKAYIERCCKNFQKGSFNRKLKLPFFIGSAIAVPQ